MYTGCSHAVSTSRERHSRELRAAGARTDVAHTSTLTELRPTGDRRRQMYHLVACLANARSHTPIVIASATACLMELRGSSHRVYERVRIVGISVQACVGKDSR